MRKLSVILLFLLPLLFSCVREEAVREGAAGEPVQLTLRFGGAATELTVGTKSTHTLANESRVYNLYLFIFDSEGRKIYGKYFDYSNLSTTGSSTLVDWWEVTDSGSTAGTVHIRTLSGSGCRVVAIANIDAEMVNISPEQLGIVSSYADLYAQKASLNQLIVSRSGYFPMSGELSGVQVAEGALEGTLMLARLDARIRFKVRVEDGSQIAGFTPLKWQVVNLPRRAWVLGRDSDAAAAAVDFFSTGGTLFETEALTDDYYSGSTQNHILEHGFSFYMLENRKAPVQDPEGVWEYAHREQQEKLNPVDASVAAQVTNGDFLYADPLATYVVITARVTMDNVTYGGSEGATLSGDVRYIVHLGDFSDGKYNDFNVQRNHGYTYSVYVRDVNDIRVEVENNYEEGSSHHFDEPEPGATGSVTVALEEVYTSDAHYSSHVMSFHERHIDPDKVTWEVQTPFNPSGGRPVLLSDGTENTVGLDFEWVEFRLNDKDADGVYFDSRRQLYKPMEGTYADGKTMNVSGLVAYLKDQKRKFDAGLPNDFDNTADEDGGPKISVTAFVNEYYYETNPLTGEYQKMLWKKFVNQPMRYMYILSETRSSADGESRIIGSSFTIQQRSIQSIYNIANESLNSAWGAEHTDDELEASTHTYSPGSYSPDRGNTSTFDGRSNSLKEWGLLSPDGATSALGDDTAEEAHWSTYMDFTAPNETPLMLGSGGYQNRGYQYLRYSCMSRNRDNNGNGIIDPEEVRWYMGATGQLIGLFMGDYGLEGSARLYQRNVQERLSMDMYDWRQHLLSSTRYTGTNSDSNPRTIWAEQCITGSTPNGSWQYAAHYNRFETRCVRNLGYDPATGADITYSPLGTEPDNYISWERLRDGQPYDGAYDTRVYYEFDCSRINEASLRYYTNRELTQHDEHSEQACLYKKFRAASVAESPTFSSITINRMNEYLNNHIGPNPYCPEGYRLCNVREASVLFEFVPDAQYKVDYNFTRTAWSFGVLGEYYKKGRTGHNLDNAYGFSTSTVKPQMTEQNSQTTTTLRCVRDIKVD